MLASKVFIKAFFGMALVSAIAISIVGAQVITDGLVHYWSFDEDSIDGNTVTDMIGGNHGEINGDPQVVDAKINGGLELDGDDYIRLTPIDSLVEHSFTIQVWIKKVSAESMYLFSQGDAAGNNRLLHFGSICGIKWGLLGPVLCGKASFRFYSDDLTGGYVKLNEWYHLVGVYDKAEKTSRLYLNGEEVGKKTNCAGLKADIKNSVCVIGAVDRVGKIENQFKGIIDEFAVYNRALGEDEIQQNYRTNKGFPLATDWPSYRHDSERSGVTKEEIETPLYLQWTYIPKHSPRPAWPEPGKEINRMDFDYAYHVAVAEGIVYFGSSADGNVYALDLDTGKELWSFMTSAPVRFAPTAWKNRVFVTSDDGWLYCLSGDDGKLLWKKRGGPRDEMLLGNERMISRWPMRSGVIVEDGVVYERALSDEEIRALSSERPLSEVLSVEPKGKLATIWSRIKTKY